MFSPGLSTSLTAMTQWSSFLIDCSGKTINNDILKKVCEGGSLILSVFDVTREESLVTAKTWIETLRDWSQVKNLPGVVIGNKTDLTERRVVPAKMGLDTATALKMQYFECSAKDNAGVEDAFFYPANEFHKLHAEQAGHMAQIA